ARYQDRCAPQARRYRGVNVLMLWAAAMEKGYNCPLWLTYKQAADLGGQVRKGEKGSLVVYAHTFTKKDTDDKGAEVETEIPFMKGYTVFNAEQSDGLPTHLYATVTPLNRDNKPFMKGYTVFNAEQIDGLPAHFYATVTL